MPYSSGLDDSWSSQPVCAESNRSHASRLPPSPNSSGRNNNPVAESGSLPGLNEIPYGLDEGVSLPSFDSFFGKLPLSSPTTAPYFPENSDIQSWFDNSSFRRDLGGNTAIPSPRLDGLSIQTSSFGGPTLPALIVSQKPGHRSLSTRLPPLRLALGFRVWNDRLNASSSSSPLLTPNDDSDLQLPVKRRREQREDHSLTMRRRPAYSRRRRQRLSISSSSSSSSSSVSSVRSPMRFQRRPSAISKRDSILSIGSSSYEADVESDCDLPLKKRPCHAYPRSLYMSSSSGSSTQSSSEDEQSLDGDFDQSYEVSRRNLHSLMGWPDTVPTFPPNPNSAHPSLHVDPTSVQRHRVSMKEAPTWTTGYSSWNAYREEMESSERMASIQPSESECRAMPSLASPRPLSASPLPQWIHAM